MIQNLLILRRSGENIYNKNLGTVNMNETVMSGFFSAFLVFSQQLCGSDIESIDLGNLYKIVFESTPKRDLLFVSICEASDSIINVKNVLTELKNFTFLKYGDKIKKLGCNLDCNEELNTFVENLLSESQELEIAKELKNKYREILNELDANNEILDSALISSTGLTATTDKDKEFLNLMVKQMEAFFRLTNRTLDQIILKFQDRYIVLYRVNKELVLSSLTKRNVPIGVATLFVEEAANKLANLYEENNK
jgi:predicted regulator of Ras-like GTPase activity (Roadblock/LC7/MglB family)